MAIVSLYYNPYTRKKELVIDGREASCEDLNDCCGTSEKELSEWCYGFYAEIYKKCNDDFTVEFTGITRDYDFMYDAVCKYKNENAGVNIKLVAKYCVEPQDNLGKLRILFEKMQKESPFPELCSDDLKNIFEKATNSEFEIAVVATMSSGKSTLINALLGAELLPARNEATTATIARIHDIDGANHFSGTSYDSEGNEIAHCDPLTAKNMEDLNNLEKNATSRIEIFGDIPNIHSEHIKLVLTDTPGPNNSRTDEHKEHTFSLLEADYKPMILYVLNGTQLETNDDNSLLDFVSKAMKAGDRQSIDRFIFVLNKADEFDPQKGELIAKKINDVNIYLAKHNIENPRIFPCAARLAKLIRQKAKNDESLSRKEKGEIIGDVSFFVEEEKIHFSDHACFLLPSTKKELDNCIKKAQQDKNVEEQALFYTGVPSIEMAISEYLSKYALPAKVSEGVKAFQEKIENLKIEAREKSTLKDNNAKVEEHIKNLKAVEDLLAKGAQSDKVKEKINNLSIENELTEKFEKCRADMMVSFTRKTQKMKDSNLSVGTAKSYVAELNSLLPNLSTKLIADTKKMLEGVLKTQAQACVDEYKKYLEGLVGKVDTKLSPNILLGDTGSISVDEALHNYTKTRKVKTGEKTVKNEDYGFWDGAKNFFKGLVGVEKKAKYLTVEEFANENFVNFAEYFSDVVKPSLEDFCENTREKSLNWGKKEATSLKKNFLIKFDQLEDAIKKKLAEQQDILANKEQLQLMIEQNKKNLEWLAKLQGDLDDILSIKNTEC
ncbi:MAG: dynamin family protein [Treponemataceae bacterium]